MLGELENLDLIDNPVTEVKDYKEKVWEMFSSLKVLDGYDKDGEECISVIDDPEGDEEGEGEGDFGDFIDPNNLTEEEKRQLEKQGFRFIEGEGEFDDGEGEDGDFEGDEEAEGDELNPEEEEEEEEGPAKGKKRSRGDDQEEGGKSNKRQKVDE